jgi:hypothetical protein
MSALKSMQRPIRNHVGAGVPKPNASATTEESVVGKKETPNKAVPPRAAPAPQAPRTAPSAVRSEPPMDVDPTELIPTIPPAGQVAAAVNQAPVAISDSDLEEDDSETLMFKRPEPQGPPRRPPPPKAKPGAPPARSGVKPPLPAPTRVEKTSLAGTKAAERPAAPSPPKPVVKPPPPKSPEKPLLAAPPANETPVELKLSERPLFEVTLGSEKPLFATPEAAEISLLAPKSANVPLLAPPQASDLGSLGLKPQKVGGVAALSMLDFSRDVSALGQSSPPNRIGSRIVDFGRAHAKWLVMSGSTVLIATVCWTVFQAAASTDTAAVEPALGTHTLAANPAAHPAATAPPEPTAQPVATEMPAAASADPVAAAPTETAPVEKTEVAEPPAAAAPAAEPAAAAVAVRPGAAPAEEAPPEEAPAERAERPAAIAAAEPVARAARSGVGTERPSSRSSDTTELPAAKAAPEPVSAPAPAAPTVGGFDGTADFDQSAAMAALRQAAESAKRCHTPDAPSGGVRIAVTFARSGAVSATQIEGAVAGTPLGDCVTAKFQSARVPPFRGSVMTVRKTVMF